MGRALLALLLLALAGCATLGGRPTPNIYVMRHLQTPAGVPNAQLTPEGRAAAALLIPTAISAVMIGWAGRETRGRSLRELEAGQS